ncbi:hypothetical protein B0H11DRAFT_2047365 [Mycena galericulata]|nr:hypothetical protein B0H11DRAFT_2047365 [Mycena galericulata]
MSRQILPAIGAFVVLTIDPMTSLDQETMEDVEAIAACKMLVSKQYVALVGERGGLYQPWAPYNACTVEFLLQGEPEDSPEKCIDPSMSVPIIPMTNEIHPSSRIPLKPSNPLPWNDCYVSTFWGVSVRSPSLWTEDPIDHILDEEEMNRQTRFLIKDRWRHEALVAQKTPISTGVGDILTQTATDTRPSTTPANIHREIPSLSASDDINPNDEGPVNPFFYNPADKQMVTVNFTHDVSNIVQLNDPADFYKEVEALARIQREARPRIAEAKARAIKAAAEMDAAYDKPTCK